MGTAQQKMCCGKWVCLDNGAMHFALSGHGHLNQCYVLCYGWNLPAHWLTQATVLYFAVILLKCILSGAEQEMKS